MRQGEEHQREGRYYHIWSDSARAYGRLPMKNSSRPQFIIELNMNLRMGGKLGSGQVQTSEAESSTFRSEAATSEPGLCRMKMEGSKVCKEVAGQEDQSKQSSESCPES